MEEQIKALDPTLVITNRRDFKDEIHVYCERIYEDKRVHDTTIKEIKDIPFNGKKVIIYLSSKRLKNDFDPSPKKTITEKFDFLNDTGRRTQRLDDELYDLTKNQNFNSSEKYAKKHIADVCGNTLIRMVEKKTKK